MMLKTKGPLSLIVGGGYIWLPLRFIYKLSPRRMEIMIFLLMTFIFQVSLEKRPSITEKELTPIVLSQLNSTR